MNGGVVGKSRLYKPPVSGVFGINDLIARPDLACRFYSPAATTGMTCNEGTMGRGTLHLLYGTNFISWSKTKTTAGTTYSVLQGWWQSDPINMINRRLIINVYFTPTALAAITAFDIMFGQNTGNSVQYQFPVAGLKEGWNRLKVNTAESPYYSGGTPNIASTIWIGFDYLTAVAATTLAIDNVCVDSLFWR
jgi:hypothetical protein